MMALTKPISRQNTDEAHVRLVYLVTLPVFVLVTTLLRLVPTRRALSHRPRSIFGEASGAARTCASLSLLG